MEISLDIGYVAKVEVVCANVLRGDIEETSFPRGIELPLWVLVRSILDRSGDTPHSATGFRFVFTICLANIGDPKSAAEHPAAD